MALWWNWHTQEVEDLCLYGIRVRVPIESLKIGSVVQWIERVTSNLQMAVRFCPELLIIAPSSNGRTSDFGSECGGSNPPGTTRRKGRSEMVDIHVSIRDNIDLSTRSTSVE